MGNCQPVPMAFQYSSSWLLKNPSWREVVKRKVKRYSAGTSKKLSSPVLMRTPLPRDSVNQGSLLPSRSTECTSRSTDRKSTRLNSSHVAISYAVFCLEKTKEKSESING